MALHIHAYLTKSGVAARPRRLVREPAKPVGGRASRHA
jgi:hypothetical protein